MLSVVLAVMVVKELFMPDVIHPSLNF